MFEELELDRQLRLGLDALALSAATEVQQLTVPAALQGQDLLVSAETGSGKTLAYLVPLAQKILAATAPRRPGARAVILVPTRELARQVLKQCRQLLALSPVQAQAITGGADFKYQKAQLRKDPEIIVATPGRLLEHCQQRSADLSALQTLVLDEADRMLDMGFRDDVLRLAEFSPATRQVLLLSTALSHRGVGAIADAAAIAANHRRGPRCASPGGIFHQLILADGQEHKDKLLGALRERAARARTGLCQQAHHRGAPGQPAALPETTLRLPAREMSTEGTQAGHALSFHEGKVTVVCASSVAAGLDISGIDLVVNYDIPYSGDNYLHRTGRTGRAGARGLAVSLACAAEWNLMVSIERYLTLRFERRTLPGLKARVQRAQETEILRQGRREQEKERQDRRGQT
ncbi:MAG: DEAD/DEAH box helicase [Halioglobus sp.]